MPRTTRLLALVILASAAASTTGPLQALGGLAAVAGWLLATRPRARAASPMTIIAGLVLVGSAFVRAMTVRWADAECRRELATARTWWVLPEFDLAPGAAGPGHLRRPGGGCTQPVRLRARSRLTGGQWHETTEHPALDARGFTITIDTATPLSRRQWRAALRAAGMRRVDRVFMQDAPMARALLLADMGDIPREVRDRWARAGLVHLLSVSGVHVAIIAELLLLAGGLLRLSPRGAVLATMLVTAGYVVILGLPPPAVRAAIMWTATQVAQLRQRPASPWSALALGALLPVLLHPAAPLDLGWQLSVLGVASLTALGQWTRERRRGGARPMRRVTRELLAGTLASAASAPLTAWHFGSISLVAPVTNLVVSPLMTLLQPTLFLAVLAEPLLPLAQGLAAAAHPLLSFADAVARVVAAWPVAAVTTAASLRCCVLGMLGMLALLWAVAARPSRPRALGVALALWALLPWADAVWLGSGRLELHLLDVGQGDAIALRTPHGQWIVVDAGGGAPGPDQGARVVLPHLRRHGGALAVFALSHPHLDHVGGGPALLGALRPGMFLDAAYAGPTTAYRAALDSAARHGVRWHRARPGEVLEVDGVRLRTLAPDSAWTAGLADANLASLILRVEFGAVAMLLTGDAEAAEEAWVLAHTPPAHLRADVLKVGHHGSRTSTTPDFLDAVAPRVALVSVGAGNRYGHPSPEIMGSLQARGVAVLRTDLDGTTLLSTDGTTVTLETAFRRWTLPHPP